MYTAELKRPYSQTRGEKQAAVNELLALLALEGCRGTRIGNAMARGISGGQVRRPTAEGRRAGSAAATGAGLGPAPELSDMPLPPAHWP